ncbi:MAG: hypothetical protein MJ252_25695, partial [archaeon]|nr:hypothetical protein [archaeon]
MARRKSRQIFETIPDSKCKIKIKLFLVEMLKKKTTESPKFLTNSSNSPYHDICGPGSQITFGNSIVNSSNKVNFKISSINNILAIPTIRSKKRSTINYSDKKEDKIRNESESNISGMEQIIKKRNLNNSSSLKESSIVNHKTLILKGEIIETEFLEIKEEGSSLGMRKRKDGHCYFGFSKTYDNKGKCLTDFIIKIKNYEPNYDKDENLRFMEIVYDKIIECFMLICLSNTLSISCQIKDKPYYFENYKSTALILGKIPIIVSTRNKGSEII